MQCQEPKKGQQKVSNYKENKVLISDLLHQISPSFLGRAAVGGVAAGGSKCCVADDVVSVGCGIDGSAAAVANATGVGGGTEAADRSSVC